MRTNAFLEDTFPSESINAIRKVVVLETSNFTSIVEELELDPAKDFQHADLRGTDLSNSDLRGYHFEGSDLRDSFGTNVIWDETTVLSGSDLSGSPFEFSMRKAEAYRNHPMYAQLENSIIDADYYDASIWVFDHLVETNDSFEAARFATLKLFEETDDDGVRKNILYKSRELFPSLSDYRSFMWHVMATHDETSNMFATILDLTSGVFANDREYFELIYATYLNSQSSLIALRCLSALRRSVHFKRERERIIDDLLSEQNRRLRNYIVGYLINHDDDQFIGFGSPEKLYPDFASKISFRELIDQYHRHVGHNPGDIGTELLRADFEDLIPILKMYRNLFVRGGLKYSFDNEIYALTGGVDIYLDNRLSINTKREGFRSEVQRLMLDIQASEFTISNSDGR